MTDEDLRMIVREFRASVAEQLDAMERRLRSDLREGFDRLRDERGTADLAWSNDIRDRRARMDARLERIEERLRALEAR